MTPILTIRSRLLPPRGGSSPVLHSITTFNRVHLPPQALLGTREDNGQTNARVEHIATIWRTAVGALAVASGGVSGMQRAAYIAGHFSLRRTVGSPSGGRMSIIAFRTQHSLILSTLARAFVFKEFWKVAISSFSDSSCDFRVRHAWASIFKATVVHQAQEATLSLALRCGAQGIFNHNEIIELHVGLNLFMQVTIPLIVSQSTLLGISIAEGDVLGLCIRRFLGLFSNVSFS